MKRDDEAAESIQNIGTTIVHKDIFRDNPVLVKALAISPVLYAATTLKNGLLLSAAMFVLLIILYPINKLISDRLPETFKSPLLVLIAGIIVTGVTMFSNNIVPYVTASVGIFLPLLAINAFAFLKTEKSEKGVAFSLFDALGSSLGFALVILIFSIIREAFGSGQLYEKVLPGLSSFKFDFILLPPGAFMLLGFLFAIVQYHKQHKGAAKRRNSGEVADK